jgi:hypothetical protein
MNIDTFARSVIMEVVRWTPVERPEQKKRGWAKSAFCLENDTNYVIHFPLGKTPLNLTISKRILR